MLPQAARARLGQRLKLGEAAHQPQQVPAGKRVAPVRPARSVQEAPPEAKPDRRGRRRPDRAGQPTSAADHRAARLPGRVQRSPGTAARRRQRRRARDAPPTRAESSPARRSAERFPPTTPATANTTPRRRRPAPARNRRPTESGSECSAASATAAPMKARTAQTNQAAFGLARRPRSRRLEAVSLTARAGRSGAASNAVTY